MISLLEVILYHKFYNCFIIIFSLGMWQQLKLFYLSKLVCLFFFQIIRMRANFLQPSSRYSKLIDDDTRHSLPISQMGNYQDHLKKMAMPLREIESAPVRQHMFGNPFKINKNMIMDEVVMDEERPNGVTGNGNERTGSIGSSPKGVKRPAASQPDSPSPMMGAKKMRKGANYRA